MTSSTYGRSVTAIAILLLIVLFSSTRAHADTVGAGDISISNVNGKPTAPVAETVSANQPSLTQQPIRIGQVQAPPVAPGRKLVGVVLYPGFEVLDVFGPVEMWAYVPDFQVVMISQNGEAVRSAQGVSTLSDYSFANAPQLDIMMVPGGEGTFAELNNQNFLNFIKKQDQATQLTTSVCTGSALLAKAGLLKGRKATSNKNFFSLAVQQDPTVDWQGKARWVEDGKYITSSGVSAGTDMALGLVAKLYGSERAGLLAHSLEYEWNSDPTNDPFAIPYTAAARP